MNDVDFWFGRNNLALTVFVPFDCLNSCKFCTSKHMYANTNVSSESVRYQMSRVLNGFSYPIRDVVFTGGEPAWNIPELKRLIGKVPERCKVYINTTLPNKNLSSFVDLVNSDDRIKGINVSRHYESYEEDCELLNDIAKDDVVGNVFWKPVRINCVVGGQNISAVINRWRKYKNVELCFRKDYTKETPDGLHNPYEPFMMNLMNIGCRFESHTQCNVCDTTRFDLNGFRIIYHRGLERSSIYHKDSDSLEINDIIIFPDGRISYDWSNINIKRLYQMEEYFSEQSHSNGFPVPIGSGGCGSGGCGGGCGISYRSGYCGGGGSGCGGGGC